MEKKYGKTPHQRLGEALNQPEQTNAQWKSERMIIEPGKEPYFVPLEAIGLKDALDRIVVQLTQEHGPDSYYHVWQFFIAKAFIDEFYEQCQGYDTNICHSTVLEIANTAAKNFLNSLCNQKNLELQKPKQ